MAYIIFIVHKNTDKCGIFELVFEMSNQKYNNSLSR